MENDSSSIGKYINCYNQPDGYYLDTNDYLYKKCYNTCKVCNKEGNNLTHNCKKCNENFLFGINKNNYLNCYNICNYYYYIDNDNNFLCTMNYSCPYEYPKLIENKTECVEYEIEDIIKTILYDERNKIEKSNEEKINYYDNILKNIEKIFTSIKYNASDLDAGKEQIIESEKLIITLTTIQNQRNNIYNNSTSIDLEE